MHQGKNRKVLENLRKTLQALRCLPQWVNFPFRYFRISFSIFLLCTSLALCPVMAQGAEWQNLIDQYSKLMTQGEHQRALAVAQNALDLAEKNSGNHQINLVLSLNALASTYGVLAIYEKVIPLYQRAVVIQELELGPEDPNTAVSLNNLAFAYSDIGQYEKAQPIFQRALVIIEKKLGKNHMTTATILHNLAQNYYYLGKYEVALPLIQRSFVIREKGLGSEHPDTASSLNDMASCYRQLAQFDKALQFDQRALAIREKALGPEHLDTASSLNNLAHNYIKLGQYESALPIIRRALKIREKVFGPSHPAIAISLNDLAITFIQLGQYDKALPLIERALSIQEKALGSEHPDISVTLSNLAQSHFKLGQFESAMPLLRRALTISEKVLGSIHPYTALSLNNLAITFVQLGEFHKAIPIFEQALAIQEKVLGSEHPDIALTLNNLAFTFGNLTQFEKSLEFHQRALAIRENVLGPDHPDTANSLNNMALTYSNLSQHEKALPLFQRALLINLQTLNPEHNYYALVLNNLAFTFLKMGQPDLAIVFYKAAVNIYQNMREQVLKIDSTALRSYTESVAYTYQNLANLLVDQSLLPEAQIVLEMLKQEEQFDFVRRSVNLGSSKTRVEYSKKERVWVTRYNLIADRLGALGAEEQSLQKQATLGLTDDQKQRLQALKADLAIARKAFEAFLNELRESFAREGPARAKEVIETSQQALSETQTLLKNLGDDAVLLQYYVTGDKVGMLLTTPGVQLARTSKVTSKELNRQIAEFRRQLRDPKANAQPAALALYQLLISPVAQDLEQAGAKTIMLSLDGALRYLPFGALHDGKQYLVERWNLPMYTSVTKDKLRDSVTRHWQAAGLGLTRAVGEFVALPAVKAEMSSIVKVGSAGVLPGEIYLDDAFSAVRLKDVSQRKFQLLHVASHFRFSPGTEVNSFLLLGDGQQLTLGDIRTQNYRFDNVDLLTLSACDTGLGGGRDAQGKEIEGFGVIAQQQGAKAVLATLWPVADQSTALLMAEMYKRRQEQSLTKIEALRQAQLSLLSQPKYAHPFYWAPFILMGNWK